MQNPIPTSDKSQGIYKGLLASIKSPDFSLLIFQVFISEISDNEHVFIYVYVSKCAYSKHRIVKISPICGFSSVFLSLQALLSMSQHGSYMIVWRNKV